MRQHITIATTATLLSILATVIMSYIAMATPIGPWIETTLVLLSMLIFYRLFNRQEQAYIDAVGLTTAAGGIGGILATAIAFSLPTLHFVAPDIFQRWLEHIPQFCFIFSSFAFAAGSFGLLMADYFEKQLLAQPLLKFPIGELIHTTIIAPEQLGKSVELAIGFIGTQILLYLNKAYMKWGALLTLTHAYTWNAFTIPAITIPCNQLPLYIAVGFVTGHVIATPLLAGFTIKTLIVDPLYAFYTGQLGIAISATEFVLALCSGIVLYSTVMSLVGLPKMIRTFHLRFLRSFSGQNRPFGNKLSALKLFSIIAINICCLRYFEFSWLGQIYILTFSAIWIYQMLMIAGAMGIIPLGRFATFMMVPGMVLFKLNMIQVTLVAAFVEIAGGVAGDALFGRKMAALGNIEHKRMVRYQWLGLCISSLVIGIVFWLFIQHIGLGPTGLPATKAASRALLINFKSFDPTVLVMGLILGYCISLTNINSALLLGGILMPPSISLMLIIGGMLTFLAKKSEHYYPLLSGVSAGNVLWMLIEIFIR